MVVVIVTDPCATLVPVPGGELDVDDVHIAVLIGITGGVVDSARCAGTGKHRHCGRGRSRGRNKQTKNDDQ